MDDLDRALINHYQGGFPLAERPFATIAEKLGTDEETVINRIRSLLEQGTLSRFGPMYHAERLGGGLTLAAMQVESADFERVSALLLAMPQVAHNYEREHALNMWFVLATEKPEEVQIALDLIEQTSGYKVYNVPKIREYFVGMRLAV